MSWYSQESIMAVEQFLWKVYVLTGISYGDEILQHHIILHMKLNCEICIWHDNAFVIQKFPQHHNVHTLPWPAYLPDLNTQASMGYIVSACVPEESTTPDTSPTSYDTAA